MPTTCYCSLSEGVRDAWSKDSILSASIPATNPEDEDNRLFDEGEARTDKYPYATIVSLGAGGYSNHSDGSRARENVRVRIYGSNPGKVAELQDALLSLFKGLTFCFRVYSICRFRVISHREVKVGMARMAEAIFETVWET